VFSFLLENSHTFYARHLVLQQTRCAEPNPDTCGRTFRYKHHKKKTSDVEVDFIRFVLPDHMRAATPAPAAAPPSVGAATLPLREPAAPKDATALDVADFEPARPTRAAEEPPLSASYPREHGQIAQAETGAL